jgi:hypothetical protein
MALEHHQFIQARADFFSVLDRAIADTQRRFCFSSKR